MQSCVVVIFFIFSQTQECGCRCDTSSWESDDDSGGAPDLGSLGQDNVIFSTKHSLSPILHLFSGPPGGPPAGLNGGIPGNPPGGGNWKLGGIPPWGGGKGRPPGGGGNGRPPALPGGGIGRGGVLVAPPAVVLRGGGKDGIEKLEPGRGGAVERVVLISLSI